MPSGLAHRLLVLLSLFATIFVADRARAEGNCLRLLQEPLHSEFFLTQYTLHDFQLAISLAQHPNLHPELGDKFRKQPALFSALRRNRANEAGSIIEKIKKRVPLRESEVKTLEEVTRMDFREGQHLAKAREVFSSNSFIEEFGASRIESPIDRVDQIWGELGFRVYRPRKDYVWVQGPSLGELSKNLELYQEKIGIPENLRVKVSVTFQDKKTSIHSYHVPHRPLDVGTDVPVAEAAATNKAYVEALSDGFVIIERDLHDIGHVVGWTAFPEAFDEVRKLGAIHVAHPEDVLLEERFRWASELMYYASITRVRAMRKIFISREAWKVPGISLAERLKRVKAEVEKISYDRLRTYIDEHLMPNYRGLFTPLGGGAVQYGEAELRPSGMKAMAGRAVQNHYLTVTPVPFDEISRRFSISRNLSMEEPRAFDFQLQEILTNPAFHKGREAMVRDMVARMEFAAAELANLDTLEVIRVFGKNAAQRRGSRIADFFRVLNGENSAIYRFITH